MLLFFVQAVLFYENVPVGSTSAPTLPAGTPRTIAVYNITGISALYNEAKLKTDSPLKIHVSFELDSNGIARIIKVRFSSRRSVFNEAAHDLNAFVG